MSHIAYPDIVTSQLRVFGTRIRTARIRRRWSKAVLAERIGIERRTIARLEEGSPGIGLGVFLGALWVLGLWETVEGIASPELDKTGAFLERQRQPKHVHRAREKELDF